MHIVWFKRDLRIEDHKALAQAAKKGPVLPLYILEPELWRQPDMSYRHYIFLQDCLSELSQALEQLGKKLIIKVGNGVDVLEAIGKCHPIESLWSHQETWNGWTYERDQAVKRWCESRNIPWHEPVQNGVVRRLNNRDGWAARWYHQMKQPLIGKPLKLTTIAVPSDSLPIDSLPSDSLPIDSLPSDSLPSDSLPSDSLPIDSLPSDSLPSDSLPSYTELGLSEDGASALQKGGRTAGLKLLHSFLYERGEGYTKEMSSPVTAFESCSRLSAHLAFGTLSIREVFQACEKRNQDIKQIPRGTKGKWSSSMRSFSGRLRWHCHFIQKLEDEPRIEFENMHPAYDALRDDENFNKEYFAAWKSGMTGYPMVDACMRALTATGWLNFRMRAMVMSFASYHLWLHWRKPALHLANLFTDYEPGIHYSQAQMQSGTTGINAIRIYNPIKQGVDHDPDGVFIRRWIPELRKMDQQFIHIPWQAASQMNGYPMPIVDEKTARKSAAEKLYGLRKNNTAHRETAQKIVSKHGSRKSGLPRTVGKKKTNNHTQRELPL